MDFISNAGSLNRILGMLLLTIVYLVLIRFASGKMAKWLGGEKQAACTVCLSHVCSVS
jgi:hypothetical protein